MGQVWFKQDGTSVILAGWDVDKSRMGSVWFKQGDANMVKAVWDKSVTEVGEGKCD